MCRDVREELRFQELGDFGIEHSLDVIFGRLRQAHHMQESILVPDSEHLVALELQVHLAVVLGCFYMRSLRDLQEKQGQLEPLLVTESVRQIHLVAHQLAVDEVDVALLQLLDLKALLDEVYELELLVVDFLFLGLELAYGCLELIA